MEVPFRQKQAAGTILHDLRSGVPLLARQHEKGAQTVYHE